MSPAISRNTGNALASTGTPVDSASTSGMPWLNSTGASIGSDEYTTFSTRSALVSPPAAVAANIDNAPTTITLLRIANLPLR